MVQSSTSSPPVSNSPPQYDSSEFSIVEKEIYRTKLS